MTPDDLKEKISDGLISFPVTPFDAENRFAPDIFGRHIDWLGGYGPAAQFVAGGAGEIFSLRPDEFGPVIRAAKEAAPKTPLVSGCGYGTEMAIQIARDAEKDGADGILLLPHYLVAAPQAGIRAHVKAVADAVGIGVILYNRGAAKFTADTLAVLCEECPNVIGFKDGAGDLAVAREVIAKIGDRLTYLEGMPTAELYAEAYMAAGFSTYSSAVFNFVPDLATRFFKAVLQKDRVLIDQLLKSFYYPFVALRDRGEGYAVSAIKAGVRLRGFDVGPVRSPLTDLSKAEEDMLMKLIDSA